MNASKISVRYAKAVFLLAKEKNVLPQVYRDLNLIKSSILPLDNFKGFITSPVVKPEDKKQVFTDVYGSKIDDITLKFLLLIVDKNRELYLIDIIRHFNFLYRQESDIKKVIVTTTEPLSNESKQKIAEMVTGVYGCRVEIRNHINDNMIGGIIVRIDNQQLDLSVKTQLKEIKHALKSEAYKIGF